MSKQILEGLQKAEKKARELTALVASLQAMVPIDMVNPPKPPVVVVPPVQPVQPPTGARMSAGVQALGVKVVLSAKVKQCYRLTHLWTTHNGSWEVGDSKYSIPVWARDEFMVNFPMAGGDHHIYALLLDAKEKPVVNAGVRFWYSQGSFNRMTNAQGFCEKDINGSFAPDRGEHGAWSVQPGGDADQVTGMGLPLNHHVSLFGVWRWIG